MHQLTQCCDDSACSEESECQAPSHVPAGEAWLCCSCNRMSWWVCDATLHLLTPCRIISCSACGSAQGSSANCTRCGCDGVALLPSTCRSCRQPSGDGMTAAAAGTAVSPLEMHWAAAAALTAAAWKKHRKSSCCWSFLL